MCALLFMLIPTNHASSFRVPCGSFASCFCLSAKPWKRRKLWHFNWTNVMEARKTGKLQEPVRLHGCSSGLCTEMSLRHPKTALFRVQTWHRPQSMSQAAFATATPTARTNTSAAVLQEDQRNVSKDNAGVSQDIVLLEVNAF